MPKKEKPKEEQIKDAIAQYQNAMIENIRVQNKAKDISVEIKQARFKLQTAREFLHNLEIELYE